MIDFTDSYGTKDRQIELLNMIECVDRILSDANIKYSLCGGTLLGAVREKGFIPWDDDIDIVVDRENLNRIIELFKNKSISGFELNEYLWVRRIQKVGDNRKNIFRATIDIFVMDNVPNNRCVKAIKIILLKILQGMMKKDYDLSRFTLPYKICLIGTRIIGKLFTDKVKLSWYDKVSQIGNKKNCYSLGMYNDLFKYLRLEYVSDLLKEYNRVPFENIMLPIMTKYDNYLSTVYGDYMTPPEESERKPIHIL